MLSIQRILLPSDFSDNARYPQAYACALAEHFDAELHLLHVYQEVIPIVPEPVSAAALPPNYLTEMRAWAEQALETWLDPDWAAAHRVTRCLKQGVPFVEILEYAQNQTIDLLVIGTHGRTGLAHVLLGSVAEKIVRKAPCPVLTVRPTSHQFVSP